MKEDINTILYEICELRIPEAPDDDYAKGYNDAIKKVLEYLSE